MKNKHGLSPAFDTEQQRPQCSLAKAAATPRIYPGAQ